MTLTERPQSDLLPEERGLGNNPPEIQAKVPFAMQDSLYVPKERYYERSFYELEKQHLWPHSWLMAARVEEIPHSGDYTEFEIVGNSILIIRQNDGSVKALHNACRHRATELAKGCGRLAGGQLVCPFHGWRWNLDGSNAFVFMDASFDPSLMTPDDLALPQCKVEIWAGMIWINMDLDAPPLAEALWPVKDMLDGVGLANMHPKWWKQVIIKANWKVTMEAFLEGYHTMQTHPQLLVGGDADDAARAEWGTEYAGLRNGHGRFQAGTEARINDWDFGEFIEAHRLLAEGQDAMALERDVQIFEGLRNKVAVDDPEYAAKAVQALFDYAEGAGIPMTPPSSKLGWGGEVFAFPNFFFLPLYSNCLCYRMRPYDDDPEQVIFDVWSLTTYPVGEEPEHVELLGVFDKEDSEHWGLIPRQDFSNIERQQRGLHSVSYTKSRFSTTLEPIIINYHQELDRVIARRVSPKADGPTAR